MLAVRISHLLLNSVLLSNYSLIMCEVVNSWKRRRTSSVSWSREHTQMENIGKVYYEQNTKYLLSSLFKCIKRSKLIQSWV